MLTLVLGCNQVSSGEPDVAALQSAVEEARAKAVAAEAAQKAILAERDTARQMLHGIKAMLAQSEALRQSSDNSHPVKVRQCHPEGDPLLADVPSLGHVSGQPPAQEITQPMTFAVFNFKRIL